MSGEERHYRNGASRPAPYGDALLHIDEVSPLDRALVELYALRSALPRAGLRRDAALAHDAILRLLQADAAEPEHQRMARAHIALRQLRREQRAAR